MPGWACVWQEGKLLARTDMLNAQTRRLSLMRNGECIGTFDLPMPTPSHKALEDASDDMNMSSAGPMSDWRAGDKYSMIPSLYYEHLAFSTDGKYLTWLIDDGKDTIKSYLFVIADLR